MHDMLSSFGLLALIVAAIVATRKRGPLAQLAAEIMLVVAIAGYLVLHGSAPIPRGNLHQGVDGAWLRGFAIVWWLVAARLVVNLIVLLRGRDPQARDARIFAELTACVIYIAAALIVLNSVLELPVYGLIATSGAIAVVIGLALQNTLADVFSGIAVGLEKPFRIGDRVSLTSNEGMITEINWRSIKIRTDADDIVSIPNSIVAKGQIINRSAPSWRRGTMVELTVPSSAPSDRVLELLRQATLLCPDIMHDPAPTLLLQRSGLMSATYSATFFVPDSLVLLGARSMFLRQARRMLHHARFGPTPAVSAAGLLASTVLLEALSKPEVQALADQLVPHVVETGDRLFEQGSTGDAIYFVESGVLELVRSQPDTGPRTLGRVGPGEYIGELGLITGADRGVTMTALTHGRVFELPGESLKALLRSNVDLNAAMERSVRRGLDLLDRDSAARAAQPDEQGPDLLARIRAFFHRLQGGLDEAGGRPRDRSAALRSVQSIGR